MQGSKQRDNSMAYIMPNAAIFPSSPNGGETDKLRVRKPTAVVTLVSKIGCRFMRRLSRMASKGGPPMDKLRK